MIIVARNVQPQSLSIGSGLSFVAGVFLLGWLDLVLSWPEIVPAHVIGGCRAILMPVILVGACSAVVLHTNWVMATGSNR